MSGGQNQAQQRHHRTTWRALGSQDYPLIPGVTYLGTKYSNRLVLLNPPWAPPPPSLTATYPFQPFFWIFPSSTFPTLHHPLLFNTIPTDWTSR